MIHNYTYRFYNLRGSPLFAAVKYPATIQTGKQHRLDLTKLAFYTIPFHSKTSYLPEYRTTIVSFTDHTLAKEYYGRHITDFYTDNNIALLQIDSEYIKFASDLMQIPMLVVLNAYCHLETKDDWVYDVYLRQERPQKKGRFLMFEDDIREDFL